MELMKIENSRYSEYEDLLLERDQLEKEANSIWIAYVQEFGQLITEIFEEKIECIKRKKTISFYQKAKNQGNDLNTAELQIYLKREMAAYEAHLDRMLLENEAAGRAEISSPYEVHRSKALYRRFAKLLHPDTHPQVYQNETLMELWQRTVEAYGRNDVRALTEIEVLARRALKEAPNEEIVLPDLDRRIEAVKTDIQNIITTEPYTYQELLDDEEKTANFLQELKEELESYQRYRARLDAMIEDLFQEGGLRILWGTN